MNKKIEEVLSSLKIEYLHLVSKKRYYFDVHGIDYCIIYEEGKDYFNFYSDIEGQDYYSKLENGCLRLITSISYCNISALRSLIINDIWNYFIDHIEECLYKYGYYKSLEVGGMELWKQRNGYNEFIVYKNSRLEGWLESLYKNFKDMIDAL